MECVGGPDGQRGTGKVESAWRQGSAPMKDSLIAELDNDSLSAPLSFRCLTFGKRLQNIVDV